MTFRSYLIAYNAWKRYCKNEIHGLDDLLELAHTAFEYKWCGPPNWRDYSCGMNTCPDYWDCFNTKGDFISYVLNFDDDGNVISEKTIKERKAYENSFKGGAE
jgi:hypothetical protein